MTTESIELTVEGTRVVGTLHVPDAAGPRPAVVLTGPLTSVKEQVAGNHARALAERGVIALAFDHRYFGASGGEPRQYESPPAKIADLRAAVGFLASDPRVDATRLGVVGVCAGAGYAAGAVAGDPRVRAFAAVAGFFHDHAQQRAWMGDGYDRALDDARAARAQFEATGESPTIPAVGRGPGPVAMPLAEAYEYYGTSRGAAPGYVNAFAVLSRLDTLPYDAQQFAPQITAPTLVIHSETALAPALARKFYDALGGHKDSRWLASTGQIDFYDDPALIAQTSALIVEFLDAVTR
jgi:uncharacterized protein